MATTTTQAKLRRCKAYPGTIMTDKVGSVEIDGRHVADFCEVNPDSFYTENDAGKVFCGTESEVITHYSTSD